MVKWDIRWKRMVPAAGVCVFAAASLGLALKPGALAGSTAAPVAPSTAESVPAAGQAGMIEILPPVPGEKSAVRQAEIQEVLDAMQAQVDEAWANQVVTQLPDGSLMLEMPQSHFMVEVKTEDGGSTSICGSTAAEVESHLHDHGEVAQ